MKSWTTLNSEYCQWAHERVGYAHTDKEFTHIVHVLEFALAAFLIHHRAAHSNSQSHEVTNHAKDKCAAAQGEDFGRVYGSPSNHEP